MKELSKVDLAIQAKADEIREKNNRHSRPDPHTIVAEISSTWTGEESERQIVSRKFEEVIELNLRRGYELRSWQFRQTAMHPAGYIVETIIAIFAKPHVPKTFS